MICDVKVGSSVRLRAVFCHQHTPCSFVGHLNRWWYRKQNQGESYPMHPLHHNSLHFGRLSQTRRIVLHNKSSNDPWILGCSNLPFCSWAKSSFLFLSITWEHFCWKFIGLEMCACVLVSMFVVTLILSSSIHCCSISKEQNVQYQLELFWRGYCWFYGQNFQGLLQLLRFGSMQRGNRVHSDWLLQLLI